ncbi:HVA22/TB2/DP1 family protein [Aspergillus thermomutatus]|uniref:Protein YOP1 n=1 Tax=Aspergillus thermomutatus TaxID=41047 RepID=A0A397HK06_ASPTH|nr:uncharacterized protein CDV56_108990 [Aspergillus thermomutatus]RHZ61553.1 hypothetical protein CDV56_108990 [Aspergillus thermomutatus]
MFGIIADLMSSVITILFPVFASYKALRSSDPSQLAPWLMYWVVLSGILLAESWTIFILGWVPFYSWFRLFFFSYLVLPQTQGAKVLYQAYVDPFLEHHEREIEVFIGRFHEQAKALGLQYFYQAIDYIREKVLGLPAQHPAPPPPPTGPAGYAQSLLSRFNIPIAAGGAQQAPANDWYSAISSAVASMTSAGKSHEARAEELSASGNLLPRELAGMSRAEKASFISKQRDLIEVLRAALAKEESNLDSGDVDDDLAYGSSLRKNRSDNSFDHINPEDIRDRSPARPERSSGGKWTSGWFGSGEQAASSGVEAIAHATEDVARSRINQDTQAIKHETWILRTPPLLELVCHQHPQRTGLMYCKALERLHQVAAHLAPSIDTVSNKTGILVELAKQNIALPTAHELHDLPRKMTTYIANNRLQVVSSCVLAFPQAVISPVLYLAGFGPMGPFARMYSSSLSFGRLLMVVFLLDSFAAWYQASFGNPVAGGFFAHFQSAAMGGYGMGVLKTALRG